LIWRLGTSSGGGNAGEIAKPELGLPLPTASRDRRWNRDSTMSWLVPVGVEHDPPLLQVNAEIVLQLVEAVA
jgi:hypothetical protein